MSEPTKDSGGVSGAIAWMANNSVAANLLMFIILVGGLLGMARTKQEVFPAFDLDLVSVAVPYPGASPNEVEQGVVLVVEEAVRAVDGVKKVTSTSSEGVGSVLVELLLGADRQQALTDVKSKVDAITSFPGEAEKPIVALVSPRREVISLVLSGDLSEDTRFALAEKVRQDLLDLPDITQVDIFGTRPLEVAIEIDRATLRSYGWSLDQVAQQIAASSLELPSGGIETTSGEVLVRLNDRARSRKDFEQIILRGSTNGAKVRLGDIAHVRDTYADQDLASSYNGQPAVRLTAYRVGSETPRSVATAVKAYAQKIDAELPPGVTVSVWGDDSQLLDDRINLLGKNAMMGLVLVFAVLAAFLDIKLAFWVALGIPISFMGGFLLMPGADVSINMISLFAFIVVLGIVVDDAIVVGENFYDKLLAGTPPMQAAIEGTSEMVVPVTFSVLTTIAAFAPLAVLPGVVGKIFAIFPFVVVSVLLFSLVESFFVLPAHLGHSVYGRKPWFLKPVFMAQSVAQGSLAFFIKRIYAPALEVLLTFRYITVAAFAGFGIIVVVGLLGGGIVPFTFFPKLEGDLVTASARLPFGAPVAQTIAVQKELEKAALKAVAETGNPEMLLGMFTRLGEGPLAQGGARASGSNLVTVELQLVPIDERNRTSEQLAAEWLAALPPLAGVEALTVSSAVGPGAGAAIEIQLSHPDTAVLAAASAELTESLRGYSDLKDVTNGYAAGKPQLDLSLNPEAKAMGLTQRSVAQQIRGAFFGSEAIREQRGRNEIKVMVRLPEEERSSLFDLENLRVQAPGAGHVPLAQLADVTWNRSPTEISRKDGRRIVSVTAELSPTAKSSAAVQTALDEEILPALLKRHPGLTAGAGGEQESQAETFRSLGMNFLFAMFAIYALLAIPFRSYLQPAIIMAVIPFGLVGAVLGHLVMGYGLSVISMMGVFALMGVAVNDSLVLIDAANGYRRDGADSHDAIMQAGQRRFRPILLTSLTTFMGLAPMILETSVGARFLIPMAISLGFGVLFTTIVTLVMVPSLYMVLEDVLSTISRIWALGAPAAEPAKDHGHSPESPASV